MSSHASATELLKMTPKELGNEVMQQKMLVAKLKLGIAMGKEKDTARYRRERRQLARMQTALTMKDKEQLSEPSKARTVRASRSKKKAS